MNKQKKLTLSEVEGVVPELRFPEFKDDEQWRIEQLGEIGKPLMCKRIFKEQTTTNSKDAIPFYKISTFGREPDAFIPLELYNEYKKKYFFPNIGDILISASGTIGRLVVFDGVDAYFQDSNIVWIGNDETQITNTLLYYCYSNLVWQTSDGGVIKRLYNSDLKKIEINFPKNPKEQQKIANCLSSLDQLITAETDKLDLLQDHKKGLLQQLFPAHGETKPHYRFPEFKNDGDWYTDSLGSLVEIKGRIGYRGYTNKDIVAKGEGAITLSPSNFDKNGKLVFEKNTYISWEKYDESPEIMLEEGQTVLVKTASVGKSAYVCDLPEKTTVNPQVVVLKPQKIEPRFLAYTIYHNYVQSQIIENIGAGAIPNMSQASIANFKILLPPDRDQKEQQKIANCLSSLEKLIEAQETRIKNLKKHKKGLMQKLFPDANELTV